MPSPGEPDGRVAGAGCRARPPGPSGRSLRPRGLSGRRQRFTPPLAGAPSRRTIRPSAVLSVRRRSRVLPSPCRTCTSTVNRSGPTARTAPISQMEGDDDPAEWEHDGELLPAGGARVIVHARPTYRWRQESRRGPWGRSSRTARAGERSAPPALATPSIAQIGVGCGQGAYAAGASSPASSAQTAGGVRAVRAGQARHSACRWDQYRAHRHGRLSGRGRLDLRTGRSVARDARRAVGGEIRFDLFELVDRGGPVGAAGTSLSMRRRWACGEPGDRLRSHASSPRRHDQPEDE